MYEISTLGSAVKTAKKVRSIFEKPVTFGLALIATVCGFGVYALVCHFHERPCSECLTPQQIALQQELLVCAAVNAEPFWIKKRQSRNSVLREFLCVDKQGKTTKVDLPTCHTYDLRECSKIREAGHMRHMDEG
ncbi:hypothetical protein C0581_00635 [Candidatus Parcubacteria bacterium]|nr:MAG: hypothetical protein C0581_00635 [Candidatus Parcubacteria bacterium]